MYNKTDQTVYIKPIEGHKLIASYQILYSYATASVLLTFHGIFFS
jgi:hypothetical protein